MSEQIAEVVNPSVTPTPEEFRAQIGSILEKQFAGAADKVRRTKATAKGLIDPSKDLTDDELRALIPLEGDTIKYAKYPEGHPKAGQPRMAFDSHGFIALPKAHGRRKKHMTKRDQAIKSAYLRISKDLFTVVAGKKITEAEAKGEKFVGLNEEEMRKIAAKATRLAMVEVLKTRKFQKTVTNRMQDLSRSINAGILPGNTDARNYAHGGSQYGR